MHLFLQASDPSPETLSLDLRLDTDAGQPGGGKMEQRGDEATAKQGEG